MAIKISIRKLKSIESLDFDIPASGTFVITGANGCGKTSLLTVLHRMGSPNAFQVGFPGGKGITGIDSIADAKISYEVNGKEVSYRYNKERWSATPKSRAGLIRQAYSEVLFLRADSSRVEPTQEELRGARKLPADQSLRDFMNSVFDTDKFSHLHKINLRGRNLAAHLIDKTKDGEKKKSWYSEKAFSLGELCVMRLGQKLLAMKNNGLYIVDEFEMALHPAAQIRLFKEIERIAQIANCVVLVSTHSSSLIKSVGRNKILYLDNSNGEVYVRRKVFPAYALQHLALDEESSADRVLFVEDVSAKLCVDEMWKQHLISNSGAGRWTLPAVHISVIGGYKEVLRFLERSTSIVPNMTRCFAVLDDDAQVACVPPAPLPGEPAAKLTVPQALYEKLKARVAFLPWTPEVGLCELLSNNLALHRAGIQDFTGATNLQIPLALARAHSALTGKPQRARCKETLKEIADQIAARLNCTPERAFEWLMAYLVFQWISLNQVAARTLCGRIFG